MGFFDRLFRRKSIAEPGRLAPIPWDQTPSIYDFVRSHIDPKKPGVMPAGYQLPDDERQTRGSKLRWAPGAVDGITTHHITNQLDGESAQKVVELASHYCRRPTVKNKLAIYNHIVEIQVLKILDPALSGLTKVKGLNLQRLYELAYSFVTKGCDREPVKLGIGILGLYRNSADEALFQTLGRHDEFTLFCATALSNLSASPENSLWTLARQCEGWGRIHTVERLADTKNQAIKNWLLLEGFRNNVANEYLAAICARAGELPTALKRAPVDRELLTSAGQILEALIVGGPAENIDHYEEAVPALESYLGHMAARVDTLEDFLIVHKIKTFFDQDDSAWTKRCQGGWTLENRERLRTICSSILSRPRWPDKVRAALEKKNSPEFLHADQAADVLGMDTWEIHWKRLRENPMDPARWPPVMSRCNDERIDATIELALANRSVSTTGAADELGLGPKFNDHTCLNAVLGELGRFPGRGGRLIETALQSPVVSNRNLAISALDDWPRSAWPEGLDSALDASARCEPQQDVRERMKKLLAGETLKS